MKYTFACKRVPLNDSIKEYAQKKISKLERYFREEDTTAFVTFSVEKDHLCSVEITIRGGATLLRAQTEAPDGDMRGAIDAAVGYIERQILKNKTRLAKRLRTEGFPPPAPADDFEVAEEKEFPIVRTKRFSVKPMSPEEALLQLTLLALIPALIMFAIGTQMSKVMTRRWEERQEAFSGLSDFAQENFSGIAVIKAFVKEYKELQAFRKLNKENEEINVTYTKIATLLEVLVTLFVESVICIILGYGGYLVYQGRFNAGQLVEYIGYFEATVWPIMAVSMLIEMTSRGRASLNRITELLDAPIDVADRPGVADLTDPKGGIEFRHLNFRYPDGEFDVLRDISFAIAPGESVGSVGKTGAGKTALVDLLLRTYNVPDGTLFVDGRDVNSLSIHSVRNACAYVPQDNFLFSDTIAHNIAFGVDDATPEDIERAASMADVRDIIVDFKDGYETVLGERGVTVSGGQKQRISIARALLKDAPILILAASVSAVDTSTEKIILDNLKNSRAGKTTLLIAHRISTVERLDKIIFLNEGRVEAVGPHDQLYASCPEYRRMVDLQRLEDETKGGENA